MLLQHLLLLSDLGILGISCDPVTRCFVAALLAVACVLRLRKSLIIATTAATATIVPLRHPTAVALHHHLGCCSPSRHEKWLHRSCKRSQMRTFLFTADRVCYAYVVWICCGERHELPVRPYYAHRPAHIRVIKDEYGGILGSLRGTGMISPGILVSETKNGAQHTDRPTH